MLRARVGRAGTPRPLVPWLLLAVAAVVVAGCFGGSADTEPPSDGPTATVASTRTEDPSIPTDPPTTAPSATPEVSTPATAAPSEDPATACSGSDDNRAFFVQAAASIDWPVVCAVLPDGWFLVSGSFQLADGGRVEVAYRGPSSASLALVQGNVCQGDEVHTCAPRDTLIAPAILAGMEGELGQLGTGLVLDVDRGANPMWRASGSGLSEAAFRAIGEAAIVVGD